MRVQLDDAMRIIQSLDSDAHLCFSNFTGQWFVSARIEISNGALLQGIAEHRPTPEDAVYAYLAELQKIHIHQWEQVLVTRSMERERREWKWNGAAFAEQRQPIRESLGEER